MKSKYVIDHILKFLSPRRHPQYVHPKAQKSKILDFFREFFFFFKFQKNKSDKMCHMGACMVRPFWDVKALSLVNLLRQKNFQILKKNFQAKFLKEISLWDRDFGVSDKQVPQVDTKTHGPKSILPWIESLYRCLSSPGARASMCTHQAH